MCVCVYVCVSFSLTAYYSWMIFSIMLLRNCKIYINVHGFIELSTFRRDWFWMKQCTLFHLLLRHVRIYSIYSNPIKFTITIEMRSIFIRSRNLSTNIWINFVTLRLFYYIHSIYFKSIRIKTRINNKWFSYRGYKRYIVFSYWLYNTLYSIFI